MKIDEIAFRTNQSSFDDICAFLLECDATFVPPLSQRVNIEEYARKLRSLSRTFEAWNGRTLVGLVAAYRDELAVTGFISTVSVLPIAAGLGIAYALLKQYLHDATDGRIRVVQLEVSPQAVVAIHLYTKLGFAVTRQDGVMQRMELKLEVGRSPL